jgi:hypothetical protein
LTVLIQKIACTLQLIFYALLPPTCGAASPTKPSEVQRCAPRQIRGGMGRFLDSKGELRLLLPNCLAIAAPVVLFRLKREGFSGCFVQASEHGLYVEARR